MGRARIFALLLLVTQALAIPTRLKAPVPPFYRYTVVREMDYRGVNCAATTDPVPISTPNPVLESMDEPVVVSFDVGADGRTYSTYILSSDGKRNDHEILRIIQTWRFRPATCNGVPIDVEGSAGFGTF
jgi:TonB family protein